jgi:hypothetical protein
MPLFRVPVVDELPVVVPLTEDPVVVPLVVAPPAAEPVPVEPPVCASASELVNASAVANPIVAGLMVTPLLVKR